MPSPRVLRRLLDYNPQTGELRWKERPAWMFETSRLHTTWNKRFANKPAFTEVMHNGYSRGRIFLIGVRAHWAAWAISTGAYPKGEIDHINGVRGDNRFKNLREVSRSENLKNAARRSDNTSGVTGVSWSKRRNRWIASINVDSKVKYLGSFRTLDSAASARKAAEKRYGFHPNHGRSKTGGLT